MNILLSPIGTLGDVLPFFTLAELVRELGHGVSFCSTEDWAEEAGRRKIAFFPIPFSFKKMAEGNGALMGKPVRSVFRFARNLRDLTDAQYGVLSKILKGHDRVFGTGLQMSALSLCESCNIPYHHIGFSPNWMPSRYHSPPMAPRQFDSLVWNDVLWRLFRCVFNVSIRGTVNKQRALLDLPVLRDVYRAIQERAIASCDEALAPLPPDCMNLVRIPYLHRDKKNRLPREINDFMPKGRPVIYIGFGSMPNSTKESTLATLVRAVDSLGVHAIIQRGWAGFSMTEKKGNVLIVDDVPHEALFPRMNLVVHHGGAGTVHVAARAGVPQVIIPHLLDQYYWGERIYRMGIGPRPVPISSLDSRRLLETIGEVLNNACYAVRAKEIAMRMNTRPLRGQVRLLLK